MDLVDIVRVLRRGLWLLALGTTLGLAGGVVAVALTDPMYESSTRLLVSLRTNETSAVGISQGASAAQSKAEAYGAVVRSQPVLQPVIDTLHLDLTPAELAADVRVSSTGPGAVMDITVSGNDASRAAEITTAITAQFTLVVDELEQPLPDGSSPVQITTLKTADVAAKPIEPRPVTLTALGGIIGLATGIGAVLLRAMADTRLRTIDEFLQAVGSVPILGTLARQDATSPSSLVIRDEPQSAAAEAYRDLRTNLTHSSTTGTTLVTSALPGEGKTFTAANLALVLAETGASVLLIDADLRQPRLAEVFGIDGTVGLSDVLAGQAEPTDVIQPWGMSKLSILPAGHVPQNPSELLGSDSMRALVAESERTFDVIIVDAAPLLPVTDAAVLSGICGTVLLVTAAQQSKREHLHAAITRFERLNATLVGVVVTKVPLRQSAEFSGKYGTYGADTNQRDLPTLSRDLAPASTNPLIKPGE